MNYGIEPNILNSPYSLILSISLIFGLIHLGNFLIKYFLKNVIKTNYKSEYIFYSPIVGSYFLLFFLYIVIIFELNSKLILNYSGYFLLLLALLFFYENRNLILNKSLLKKIIKELIFIDYVILILLFLLLLISASPPTHSDTLDYHISGALNLLSYGHFNKEILPMNFNLVSVGEILIAIGLSLKAYEFGGMIQFVSLLALIPLYFKSDKKFFLILILTCPITFFLSSTPKPQLLFVISSLLIFIFSHKYLDNIDKKKIKFIFPLILLVLAINGIAKYSFNLSSFILGFYIIFILFKKRYFIQIISSIIIVFLITYLPLWMFKNEFFFTDLPELLLSPLPINIYGYQGHHNLLSGGNLSITGIFFPNNINNFSTTYGPLTILLFLMFNKEFFKNKAHFLMSVFFIVSVFAFGSNLPRFLFEGYLWIIYLVSISINYNSKIFKIFSKLIYLQMIIIVPIFVFFVITIFPGSISEKMKRNILINNANGYELSEWANERLSNNDVLLSTHRSISLFKNKTFSSQFLWHVDFNDNKSEIYSNFLKKEKVNRILFYGKELKKYPFEKCLGKELFFKKNVGRMVGRNPFRKGDLYNGWIFKFDYDKLPNCLSS